MNTFRVALSRDFIKADGSPAYPMFDLNPLSASQIEYQFLQCEDEIDAEELADYDALILLAHRFSAASVPKSGRLAVIARFGVGYDTVDVEACTRNSIALAITPDGVRRPVAVSVMAFILALTGKLLAKDHLTRSGPEGWTQRSDYMGVGLVGKTLGLVGIGNIGAEVCRLAKPFDLQFIAHDPYADPAVVNELGIRLVDLDELFRSADILSINCPLNDQTHHLVNAEKLALMKPSAYLINTARGPVVDEQALVAALRDQQIAGAGLDVFEQEPTAADNPLFEFDNVIVTPHALCWTDECFAGNGAADIKAVLSVMRGEVPTGIVNRAILDDANWQAKLSDYKARFGN